MTDIYTHQIEIYTASLVISGAYDLTIYRRVSDAINGEQRHYIPLRDATVAPLTRLSQAQRVPTLLVDRTEALLITAVTEADPPENYPIEEQIRGALPVTAMFFTEAFVVRGTFYRRPNHDLTEALERLTDDFLPLRQAQIFSLHTNNPPIVRNFTAVARTRIIALYQLADAPAPPPQHPIPIAEEPVEVTEPEESE